MTVHPSLLPAGMALASILGALLGGLAGCVPALHIYNVLGATLLLAGGSLAGSIPPDWINAAVIGLVVGWVVVNSLPAILLSAPDESTLFTVLPGHRYLMMGRGYEAILLTAVGAAGGLTALIAGSALAPRLLPAVHATLAPHYHWIIWSVIAFMLLSEWPQGRTAALRPLGRLLAGTRNATMGLLTFALSGWLGFLLLYRPDLVPAAPGQALTPAFAGLFAMPWLLMNLVSRTRTPPQQAPATLRTKVRAREVLHGLFAGVMGGAFAALIPAVSGGIGGMLAGHATTLRDDRAFLISQGASKTVYYAGALLLWFVPGLHLSRGGGTALLRGIHDAPPGSYGFVVATIALSAAAALLSLPLFSRAVIGIINRFGLHSISWFAVAMILLVVGAIAGPRGWLVMGTATGIGLIPALSGARRMNALGIILLPLACNMSGVGPAVARFLGVL